VGAAVLLGTGIARPDELTRLFPNNLRAVFDVYLFLLKQAVQHAADD